MVGAFKVNPLQDICGVLQIEDLSVEYPDLQTQRAGKLYLQKRFKTEFLKKTTQYWIEGLETADILCAPVNDLAAVLEDEQTAVNELVIEFDHPVNGKMKVVGCPIQFSANDCGLRLAPPRLGEHNDEILTELGMEVSTEGGCS